MIEALALLQSGDLAVAAGHSALRVLVGGGLGVVAGVAAEDFTNLQAVDLRQHQIEHDERRALVARHRYGAGAVLGKNRSITRFLEFKTEHFERVGLVVNDQYFRFHS